MCVHLPDPKNAGIVHHIFGVLGKQAGKPNLNGTVGCTCCSPQAHPKAASDRKLGGLGSKLHLVREENAAFVSFSVCAECIQ